MEMKTYLFVLIILYTTFFFHSCICENNKQVLGVEKTYIYPNSEKDFLLGKNICYYALADSFGEVIDPNKVIREEDYITQKIMIDDRNLQIVQDSTNRYYLYDEQPFKINRILIDSLSGNFFNFDNLELSWDLGTSIYKKNKSVLMISSDLRWCGLANQYRFIQFFDLKNMVCYEFFVNYYSCLPVSSDRRRLQPASG
jgi:hypothetical protein